ncbi:DUF3141 domain-containing protein [Pseudaestuariivita rosea]|uniref:DUF3141 domain-containing protein n=1 Tax=Pseudaestuariivita rosea TaxID=2763263 RepID=UPI001ABA29CE|nr:DUF3141 domain-containing protein [Pseudaestuariivita rosea]
MQYHGQTKVTDLAEDITVQNQLIQTAMNRHAERSAASFVAFWESVARQMYAVGQSMIVPDGPTGQAAAFSAYLRDATERGVLTLDALRQRSDTFLSHKAAGCPPVLIYDYEVIVEGRDLHRPSNYMLLRILPPKGIEIMDWKRPYVIIDPRAGHGAGIGGFKNDSQVGVALSDGHPVYFVAFHPDPVPGQTIADVTHSEAEFLRMVMRRHPDSPKPIVVGNCQGGWAIAILAATYPDLTGPIVLNGAPMSYWGGKLGQDPMRYSGGIAGGVVPAMFSTDLGGGLFDGANLVQNFESLNPGRTWFRKYADLYQNIDHGLDRFIDFERWWGGFYLMTEAEIRWIVETLFIGNRLGKNEAFLEPGRPIDLKAIRAPIIVFASHGDNITPPAQALNWIIDTYTDEREIEIRGQRILYMVHEQVGHLGIFVSSSVAKREHTQMASTLKTIEALAPGLYEMQIEDHAGEGHQKTFTVSFAKRRMQDILDVTGLRRDEAAFAGVARASEAAAEVYETTVRPALQALNPPELGALRRQTHPMRLSRAGFASTTPGMAGIARAAEHVSQNRQKAGTDNPFVQMENVLFDMIERSWDIVRDMREATMELSFLSIWASPLAMWYGAPYAHTRARKRPQDLRSLPEVERALSRIEIGGLAEATVRMLVLLASSRGSVRRDRLERSSEVLTTRAPFSDLQADVLATIIHEQTLIAQFSPDDGLSSLPKLLRTKRDRTTALDIVIHVLGSPDEMEPATKEMLENMKALLGSENRVAAAE